MTIPVISSLPEIPAYSDANFETKAPAVLSALRNTFIAEMNAAIAAINNYDYGAAVNANIITGQVAVANGGTGLSSLAAGRIPYGAGTGNFGNSENFVYTSEKLGIGTTAPAKKLEVKDATAAQARLTHSSGNYTDFQTDGDGNLTIAPSGGVIKSLPRNLVSGKSYFAIVATGVSNSSSGYVHGVTVTENTLIKSVRIYTSSAVDIVIEWSDVSAGNVTKTITKSLSGEGHYWIDCGFYAEKGRSYSITTSVSSGTYRINTTLGNDYSLDLGTIEISNTSALSGGRWGLTGVNVSGQGITGYDYEGQTEDVTIDTTTLSFIDGVFVGSS